MSADDGPAHRQDTLAVDADDYRTKWHDSLDSIKRLKLGVQSDDDAEAVDEHVDALKAIVDRAAEQYHSEE